MESLVVISTQSNGVFFGLREIIFMLSKDSYVKINPNSLKYSYFSVSIIFMVCSFSLIYISLKKSVFAKPEFANPEARAFYPRNLSIYMGVICVSDKSPRTPSLLHSWGNEFISTTTNTVFKFVSTDKSPPKFMEGLYIQFNQVSSMKHYRHVFYMNYVSARDFYYNSTCDWYVRTTYDCFVHLEKFYEYMNILSRRYNPLKDIVFKGKVINYNKRTVYIHGGCGWIMSRAAVQKYLELESNMSDLYYTRMMGDDINIADFPKLINMSLLDVDDGVFLGPPIPDEQYELTKDMNFSRIKERCAFLHEKPYWPVPFNQIIFYHNAHKNDYAFTRAKKMIDSAPPYTYVQSHHHGAFLCLNT